MAIRGFIGHTATMLTIAFVCACGTSSPSLSAGSASPPPTVSGASTPTGCSDPAKCSTPPPGYTPYPGPPCDAPLTTPAEIRMAAAAMHVGPGQTAPPGGIAAYGEPVLVHAMRVGDPDEWLVPRTDGAQGASEVVAVGVRANGRGCAGMSQGWWGPFPRISLDAARGRAAGPNDPVGSIEAVYMPFNKSLPVSSGANMVWRVVRQSGHEVILFDSGSIYEGSRVREILGGDLRGDLAGATPRPSPSFPPRYPVANADQVLVGLRTDPFFIAQLRYLRAETGEPHVPVVDPQPDRPLRTLGLHKPYTVDLWIVPVRDRAANVVSIIAVSIADDGLGSAVEARGWSGAFPRISSDDAKRLGSAPNAPAITAELGWAEEYYVAPGGPTAPSWLVTRQGGERVVVTEDGTVVMPPK